MKTNEKNQVFKLVDDGIAISGATEPIANLISAYIAEAFGVPRHEADRVYDLINLLKQFDKICLPDGTTFTKTFEPK